MNDEIIINDLEKDELKNRNSILSLLYLDFISNQQLQIGLRDDNLVSCTILRKFEISQFLNFRTQK